MCSLVTGGKEIFESTAAVLSPAGRSGLSKAGILDKSLTEIEACELWMRFGDCLILLKVSENLSSREKG